MGNIADYENGKWSSGMGFDDYLYRLSEDMFFHCGASITAVTEHRHMAWDIASIDA